MKRNIFCCLFHLSGMPSETTMAICSMIFGGVLERFPKLKICFAHGGKDQMYLFIVNVAH